MALKPFDTEELRDPEPSSEQFAHGATGINHYAAMDATSSMRKIPDTHRSRVVTVVIAIVAVAAVAVLAAFVIAHFAGEDTTVAAGTAVDVTIPSGAGDGDIAQLLQDNGVISSTTEFLSALRTEGLESSLQSGTYHLKTGMSTSEALDVLKDGPEAISITIPEGFTVSQIAARVEEVYGIPQEDFLNQAKASIYVTDFPFLSGAYNDSLEGFLYPETYQFGEDVTADTIIRTMLNQYATVTSTVDFSQATQGSTTLTEYQVIVLASLIEKETAVSSERPLVSSVIYNRLNAGWYLQIDAAIAYALNKYDLLTEEDLTVDSPYNVYTHYGLPPGPICSPSLDSINAAVNPAETNYYYYVASSNLDGTHVFCETEEEFAAARDAYNAVVYSSSTTQTDTTADQTSTDTTSESTVVVDEPPADVLEAATSAAAEAGANSG
jgi:UPF0755 protein